MLGNVDGGSSESTVQREEREAGGVRVAKAAGTESSHMKGIKIAILEVSDARGETDLLGTLAVMLEETLALEGLADFPTAFGLLYVLNIEYPKEWRCTFKTAENTPASWRAKLSLNLVTEKLPVAGIGYSGM
ncbi:hypothetical protein MHYP_G00148110 [Metynnis hypsauchen]